MQQNAMLRIDQVCLLCLYIVIFIFIIMHEPSNVVR